MYGYMHSDPLTPLAAGRARQRRNYQQQGSRSHKQQGARRKKQEGKKKEEEEEAEEA
jgi:hypothetical protein